MKRVLSLAMLTALILLLSFTLNAQTPTSGSPFTISRSSGNEITIRFELPDWDLESVERDGETLHRINVVGANYNFIDETETLPIFGTMVAIPYSGGATLNLLGSAEQTREMITLDFNSALSAEKLSGRLPEALYPAQAVLMSEPQVLRDFRVVTLNVNPFQYDQQRKQLVVRQSMDIRIQFDNLPSVNEMLPPVSYSSAYENIYQGLILNYDEFSNRETAYANPRMLVVYGNYADATYLAKVNEYVAWKRQKGFLVDSYSTAVAGTSNTALKAFIQARYDNTATRPDYIVLIGDVSGSMPVPTYNSYIDYYYTWLSGGDYLGDAIIGRISVENTEQLINYMAKIESLEKNINLGTAAWLNKMVLVGDTASSGISTIYTNEYIHDHSLAINPDYTYTEIYSGDPSESAINAAINQGVVFYNYRGYIGMSGWPSYISQLNNSYRLFHGVFITCNTGTFGSGESTTETAVRHGTSSTLGGAVTAIGMATSSTHTPMNNCLNVGIFHGLYPLGMRDMAEAMLYGKLYLYSIYGVSYSTQAYNFSGYCNIIGDPTAAVYVGIPSTFTVDAPASIPAGAVNMSVEVLDASNQPVEGASVVLTNASGQQALAFSDSYGIAYLELSSALSGDLTLTVNKNDFKPSIQTVSISSGGGIVYDGAMIDDSEGNADGEANAGESVEIYISLKNTTSSVLVPSGNTTCADPYITLTSSDRIEFNAIAPNASGESTNSVGLTISADCPDQHQFVLEFLAETTAGNWTVLVPILVSNGKLILANNTFVGAPGNNIYPGDEWHLTFDLTNIGSANLSQIYGTLASGDNFLQVMDSQGYFGNINQGSTATNSSNTFIVSARSTCIEGMVIPMELNLSNAEGFEQTLYFSITIGQTTVNDPLGQDAYGYFIFDESDTGYDQCPTYNWIGIAPVEGGSGTALSLTDPGSSYDEGDQVGAVSIQTVNLPFSFKYYGVDYSRASISSNGFIAFGETNDSDWRNWRLPDAGGPSPMIAVFWDDMDIVSGTSNVYTWYNSTLHYYVVEWYNMISGYDSSTPQTFQAILYDPVYYPTHTGDGQIKLQYKDFNNIDLGDGDTYPHGNYCTIGIEDHTELVGLEYTFGNTYPTAAAPLSDESALFITTRPLIPDYPYVVIEQTQVVDPNSNAHLEPGEASQLSIRLGNRGLVDATGVSATLSSSDPYVTITTASATYGTIPAQGSTYPQTNYAIQVAPGCPAGHNIAFTLNITGSNGPWNYNFQLGVYVPELEFSELIVNDYTGNHNGILDPGETATLTIHLNNVGEIPSPAGTASLSCSTQGITVLTNTDSFPALNPAEYEVLTFSISASSSMSDGTLVELVFNAVAGTTTATATEYLEVGEPLEVVIGNGTSVQSYPLDRYYNYSAHEAIYLASEINMAGTLKSAGFFKGEGGDLNPIESVSIYMKNTPEATISSGNYSTSGYTLVYSGSYPNNAASGWMEVDLNPMFSYDGVSNLAVLTIKGYQQWINDYPQWTYTATTPSRARQNRSDSAAPINLLATNNLPNLRLKVFPEYDMLYPPQDLTAAASHQSVLLNWSAPVAGTPSSYKVYRNSSLLATVTGLSYTDLAVTNGVTYTYYLIASYAEGDSDPTSSVAATPNMHAPTNLVAVGGNAVVNLTWDAADGRTSELALGTKDRSISSYRIYRNGSALTTTTGTSYQDTGLTNGVSYSYYVTTLYVNPAGESAASNTASATPTIMEFATIGSGTSVTTTNTMGWNNITYKSNHCQAVYTATELAAAGVVGPVYITQIGFFTNSQPNLALTNFIIRMKHTTETNASSWHDANGLVTVYSNPSYMPVAGQFEMLTLSTPFEWNGTDNILIDTANSPVAEWSYSGSWQYTTVTSGYRRAYNDDVDQTNVFSGGNVISSRPNVRLQLTPVTVGPMISLDPASIAFGSVNVNSSSVQQFTIQNTGDQTLTGTISTPAGFSVAQAARETSEDLSSKHLALEERNTISISVNAGQTKTYNLTFAPTAIQAYSGNVVIATNAGNTPNLNLAVSGTGAGAEITVAPLTLAFGSIQVGSNSTQQFTIQNTGNIALTGSIVTPTGYTVALSTRDDGTGLGSAQSDKTERNTLALSVSAGQTRTYNLTFAPSAATAYNGNVVITSNDADEATVNIAVTGTGYIPPNITVNPADMAVSINIGANSTDTVTIGNTGGQTLNFTITESPSVAWFNASPLSGSIAPSGNRLITGTFNAAGLNPGTYQTTMLINTNDPDAPQTSVPVSMTVNNTAPTIELPAALAFDQDGTLNVDFDPYVNDNDGQSLVLDCIDEANILVSINGLQVTFSAVPGWTGTEILTFTVYDGYATVSDTVPVTVNMTDMQSPVISSVVSGISGCSLQWNSVPNATGYKVYRGADPYGAFTYLATTTATSYQDNQTLGMAFYRVIAVNEPPAKQ